MILAGVCFYLVPMFVATLGKNQAFTGRLLMIYAVIMVLLVPLVAKFAITYKRQVFFMNMGAIFSGIGLIYLGLSTDIWALIICIVFIGLGQAMSISSQSSLVAQVVDEGLIRKHSESGIYGAYRFNERLGNAFGPILAATLIVSLGYQSTFLVFGVISLIATILGYVILLKNQQKLELIN
jgi:Na+/melibiose symporter-like transporter